MKKSSVNPIQDGPFRGCSWMDLSRESNYIVDAVMWPKFSNSSISMRDVIKFGQKNQLFLGVVLVQVQFKFGTSTRYGLEILHQCGKRVKIKSQKFSGANSYVCRSCRGKTGSESLFEPPSLMENFIFLCSEFL